MGLTAHQGYTPRATKINIIIFGIFQNEAGNKATFGGCFHSQIKKPNINIQLNKNGTRNLAVLQPYEAPKVRPKMSRIVPDN